MKLLVTGGAGYIGSALVASSDKIRGELGWRPERPELEAMISDAWEWLQSHPRGYG